MNIFEIVSAIVLILSCVFIVIVILMKDTKNQMSQSISGTSSDSFYQKNAGRTKDAMLNKATIVATILFFVLAVAVNLINVYGGKKASAGGSTSSVVTSSETSDSSGESSSESSESSESSNSSDTSDTSDTSTESSAE